MKSWYVINNRICCKSCILTYVNRRSLRSRSCNSHMTRCWSKTIGELVSVVISLLCMVEKLRCRKSYVQLLTIALVTVIVVCVGAIVRICCNSCNSLTHYCRDCKFLRVAVIGVDKAGSWVVKVVVVFMLFALLKSYVLL